MAPATTTPIQDYLDTLAIALAAAAKWWRQRLGEFRGNFSQAQLDTFEGHLTLGLAKLLLENAANGLSWQQWVVNTSGHNKPLSAVLTTAAAEAGIRSSYLPWATKMWLKTTADQVQVQVLRGRGIKAQHFQIWPLAATKKTSLHEKPDQ